MTNSLQQIQSRFQAYVLGDEREGKSVKSDIRQSLGLATELRLGIYYDAYRLRLKEAMSESFPKTHTYLGDEMFDQACDAYIEQFPSQFRNLRWFGLKFPELLQQALEEYPVVAELARLEWALSLAFDAPDVPVLEADELRTLSEQDWAEVGLSLHSSLQILNFHTNASAIWLALNGEQEPPEAIFQEQAHHWVVWRKQLQSHFRSIGTAEANALEALRLGKSFAQVCELADQSGVDDTEARPGDAALGIASWLQNWIADGMLSKVDRAVSEGCKCDPPA